MTESATHYVRRSVKEICRAAASSSVLTCCLSTSCMSIRPYISCRPRLRCLPFFSDFRCEAERDEFEFVVPDFRLNHALDELSTLPQSLRDKTEFLCNECCSITCRDRKHCYEAVSRRALGEDSMHVCTSPDALSGYRFSKAMHNPSFIGVKDIQGTYLPMGFTNFKIEGRSLGSALILEFLLYYMTKPEYQINVREEIYLDNALDLF